MLDALIKAERTLSVTLIQRNYPFFSTSYMPIYDDSFNDLNTPWICF